MKTLYIILGLGFLFVSFDVSAAHCGGGHKEIKETTDTSSEEEEKSTSN